MNFKDPSRRLSFESIEYRRMLATLVDLDGDSDLDLLGDGSWYENVNGYGKFKPHEITDLDAGARIVTADFDGDGDVDIFTSSGKFFRNQGAETYFSDPETVDLEMQSEAISLTTFDLGSDDDRDIVLRTYDSSSRIWSLAILENTDGSGTFKIGPIYRSSDFNLGSDTVLYAADDANGNGRIDLLASYASADLTYHVVSVLSLQTDESFKESNVAMIRTGGGPVDVNIDFAFLDINSDSHLDVLGSSSSSHIGTGSTVAYWNDGQLDFSSNTIVSRNVGLAEGSVYFHRMSDVDRDGDLDAVIHSRYFGGPVFSFQRTSGDFWKENVDGTFASCECEDAFHNSDDVGDINNDGFPDFVKLVLDRREDKYDVEWYDGSANTEQGIIDATQRSIRNGSAPINIDLDQNGVITNDDLLEHLNDMGLVVGDVNLDGQFGSVDLIQIFQIGEFEDSIDGNSSWSDGDWNSDGDFNASDLTFAMAAGGYQQSGLLSLTRGSISKVESPDRVPGSLDKLADNEFSVLGVVVIDAPTSITFMFDQSYTLTKLTIFNDVRGDIDLSTGIERFELIFQDDDDAELSRFTANAVDFFNAPVQDFDFEDVADASSVVMNVGSSHPNQIAAVIEIGFWGFPTDI